MWHRPTTASVLILVAASATAAPPDVFSQLDFDAATERATDEGRWLIVKGTAAWCMPCKQMDKTTWVDESVVAWIDEHAVAIQVDVDRSPKTAKALLVRAMPTMIALRDGEEFDRVVGYQGPEEFLTWLEGIERGERASDRIEAAARKPGLEGRGEVDARYNLARNLLGRGEYAEALVEFEWLWTAIPTESPSMIGVRGSFMASQMTELARAHAPARERFAALRDELREGDDDWIVLNEVVGDNDRTLAWFDRVKTSPAAGERLARSGFRLERRLTEAERWSDLAYLYPRPLAKIGDAHDMYEMTSAMDAKRDRPADMRARHARRFQDQCGRIVASLLAAGRADEAEQALQKAVGLDDSDEMREALVAWAVRVGQPRDEAIALVDSASGGATHEAGIDQRVSILEEHLDDLGERLDRVERLMSEILERLDD